MLGAAHLSKSAVSRVVSRLKALFASWQARDLATERYAVLFLDGFHLKVRLARRVVAVPVLAVLGVTATGEKRLVALRLAASEAAVLWNAVLRDLTQRGLPAPVLVVLDGAAGLKQIRDVWPDIDVQRCTTHKWRNLETHCPGHARAELKRDYDRIIYADDGLVGAGGVRRVRQEVDHPVPGGGTLARGSRARALDVLHVPGGDVEGAPDHEHP